VIDSGASTLAVDSLGTPVMTTGIDAVGGSTSFGGVGMGMGMGMGVIDPYGLGTIPALMDTSGLGTGVGLTATMGEAVGNYDELSSLFSFIAVDTSASFFVLPANLQAFIPDQSFIAFSPPLNQNYILACDILGTRMCYYYYYY